MTVSVITLAKLSPTYSKPYSIDFFIWKFYQNEIHFFLLKSLHSIFFILYRRLIYICIINYFISTLKKSVGRETFGIEKRNPTNDFRTRKRSLSGEWEIRRNDKIELQLPETKLTDWHKKQKFTVTVDIHSYALFWWVV